MTSVVGELGTATKTVVTGLQAESFLEAQGQCQYLTGKSRKARSLKCETEHQDRKRIKMGQ